eukprot:jgi/Antlo1/1085/234
MRELLQRYRMFVLLGIAAHSRLSAVESTVLCASLQLKHCVQTQIIASQRECSALICAHTLHNIHKDAGTFYFSCTPLLLSSNRAKPLTFCTSLLSLSAPFAKFFFLRALREDHSLQQACSKLLKSVPSVFTSLSFSLMK